MLRSSSTRAMVCGTALPSFGLLLDLVRCGPAAKPAAASALAGKLLTDNSLSPYRRLAARGRPGSRHLAIPGQSGPSQANVAALRRAAARLDRAGSGLHLVAMTSAAPPASSDQPAPEAGLQVRRLLRSIDRATLATRQAEAASLAGTEDLAGWPYASLVLLAVEQTAAPLLLISDLAEHTRNIRADPRVALLVDGTVGLADPLTGARASLLGRAVPCAASDDRSLARYVARHPAAALYAGFKDFHLFRVELVAAHLVAGFGRIHWAPAGSILRRPAPALAEAEAGIIAHMNAAHAEALDLMAGAAGFAGDGWQMTGIDPEGLDLRRGARVARIEFDAEVSDAAMARAELARLTGAARAAASAGPAAG